MEISEYNLMKMLFRILKDKEINVDNVGESSKENLEEELDVNVEKLKIGDGKEEILENKCNDEKENIFENIFENRLKKFRIILLTGDINNIFKKKK